MAADLGLANMRMPVTPGVGPASTRTDKPASTVDKGPSFRDSLESLQPATKAPQTAATPAAQKIRFSNHAVERMQSRGIQFQPEQLQRIEEAVQKAAQKGAKETLLLTDEAALIVSVKNNTVVTVMDKAALKNNVFTNIDSTVMI